MNILIIGRSLPEKETGMMGYFEFQQSISLARKHKVYYIYFDDRSLKWQKKIGSTILKKDDVNVRGFSLPLGGTLSKKIGKLRGTIIKGLIKSVLKKEKIELIQIHYPLIVLNKQIFNFLVSLNIPIFITEHWSKVMNKEISERQIQLLDQYLTKSDAFITVSNELKESIVEITDTRKEIQVIPNMLNLGYNNLKIKKDTMRNEFIFVAVSRFVPEKQFDIIIKSFKDFHKVNNNIKLYLIGDGPDYNRIKRLVDKYQLNKSVVLTGFLEQEELMEKLKESSVFINNSLYETFGVPIIEAMACGLPVIIPSNSPIVHYIDEKLGVVINSKEQEALTDSLKKVYENYCHYDSEYIRGKALTLFSEDSVVKSYENIYKEFVKK